MQELVHVVRKRFSQSPKAGQGNTYNTNRNYLAGGSGRLLLILALLHVWNVDCTHISDAIGRFYILVRSLDQNQSIYII